MYVSHPVRRVRDDPTPGERVELVVALTDDADPTAVRAAVESLEGRVVEELRFADFRLVVPEPAVADLCARDDLARVETGNVLGVGVDPGLADDAPADTHVD